MFQLRIGRFKIELHFTLFVLFAFCNLFAGFEDGSLLLISVFFHETAHLAVMLLFKQFPKKISLSALGMQIVMEQDQKIRYGQNILISLAGPLMNLILFFIASHSHLDTLAAINLSLGLLHILPVEPLDGGFMLRSFLSLFLQEEKAGKITFIISLAVLFPISVLGFAVLLYSRNNFTLLLLALYLLFYLLFKKR